MDQSDRLVMGPEWLYEHTGGGCMWMRRTFTFDGKPFYACLTTAEDSTCKSFPDQPEEGGNWMLCIYEDDDDLGEALHTYHGVEWNHSLYGEDVGLNAPEFMQPFDDVLGGVPALIFAMVTGEICNDQYCQCLPGGKDEYPMLDCPRCGLGHTEQQCEECE